MTFLNQLRAILSDMQFLICIVVLLTGLALLVTLH